MLTLISHLDSSSHSHGKIGFQDLARAISARWKTVTVEEKEAYLELAKKDKQRYLKEMDDWRAAIEEEYAQELSAEEAPEVPKTRATAAAPARVVPNTQTPQIQSQPQSPPQLNHYIHAAPQMSSNVVNYGQYSYSMAPQQQHQPQEAISNDNLLMDDISSDFWDIHDDTPAPQTQSMFMEPQPIQEQHNSRVPNMSMDRFLMADLVNKLDQDCQDFLVTAFARS